MCRIERWDVRTLRRKIGGKLYVADGELALAVVVCRLSGLPLVHEYL